MNCPAQRPAFFALRLSLAFISTLIECRLYRSITEHISPRVGRYFAVFTILSAGMWNASTAFLPSSFALYLVNLAFSFALDAKHADDKRTYEATTCFAVAAIVGWPFAALLAAPFVLEELFVRGANVEGWQAKRVRRLALAALGAAGMLVRRALAARKW